MTGIGFVFSLVFWSVFSTSNTVIGRVSVGCRLFSGGQVDVVLEMLANVNLEKDLEMVGSRGRIIVVGSRGSVTITPRFVRENVCSRLIAYVGLC